MIERKYIDVFIEGLKTYFDHLDSIFNGPPEGTLEVGAPYLLKSDQNLGMGYTGLINVTGSSMGTVFVSAPGVLLKRILLSYGESDLREEFKRDLIGEIANTLAGNARRYLGSEFHISTPRILLGQLDLSNYTLSQRCYLLPFRWRSSRAELLISIQKN